MSSQAKKLAKKLPERNTKLGNDEIVLTWVDEATGQYEIFGCGDVIPTYLYNQAKGAGRALKEGKTFQFRKKNDRGNIIECRVTCVKTPNGFLRADYDDADRKANRERRRIRDTQVAELKRLYGLDGEAARVLEESAGLGQMFQSASWLESALKSTPEEAGRNVLLMIFRSVGPVKLPEEEMRDVLNFLGYVPPVVTGRAFTGVMFGVKALLTQIGFKGRVADISGQPKGNGNSGEAHLSTEEIDAMAQEQADHLAEVSADSVYESEEETEAELAAA